MTLSDQCYIRALKNFNPHSREGSDAGNGAVYPGNVHFNPHSREGSDYTWVRDADDARDFNPHSREGSDSNFA